MEKTTELITFDIPEIKTNNDNDNPTIAINEDNTETILPLKRNKFVDDKEKIRFIKNVERLIRSSIEYKEFVGFVKYTLGNDYCVFTLEKDIETDDIELHHHPLTLFEIVQIVIDTKLHNEVNFNTFDIATEVINLHYKLKIGFVPLIRTLHKKYHNGYLNIPIDLVVGDYKYILNNYFVEDDIRIKVQTLESITLNNMEDDNIWYPGIKKLKERRQSD